MQYNLLENDNNLHVYKEMSVNKLFHGLNKTWSCDKAKQKNELLDPKEYYIFRKREFWTSTRWWNFGYVTGTHTKCLRIWNVHTNLDK